MDANFTKSEYKLWMFLSINDPFGDRWSNLPTIKELIELLEISQATFYRAIAKFTEFRLFDFKGRMQFMNLRPSKTRKNSQKCEEILKNEKESSEMRENSQKCENRSPEVLENIDSSNLQTSQIISECSYSLEETHTKNDFSEEGKDSRECKNQVDSIDVDEIRQAIALSINDEEKTKISAGSNTSETQELQEAELKNPTNKEIQDTNSDNYSYGKAKKDRNFIEWLARDWVTRFGDMTIHKARSNVRAYLINQPEKCEIRWEEYQIYLSQKRSNEELRNQSKKQSSVNVYSDEYGNKMKVNDFTGCHDRQEAVQLSEESKSKFADFGKNLFGKKLNRKKIEGFGGK